jgi:hypothetical protein
LYEQYKVVRSHELQKSVDRQSKQTGQSKLGQIFERKKRCLGSNEIETHCRM